MAKKTVTADRFLAWGEFRGKPAESALPAIYDHARKMSQAMRDWYWVSIKIKRRFALSVLGLTLVLLIFGAVLPIISGIWDKSDSRLLLTQTGVVSLTFAGLLQVADRVFGWSSGWLRYITTVMSIENVTRKFELDWAAYIVEKSVRLGDADIKPLFDVAKQFEDDIAKLQTDETAKWVVEFSGNVALLGEMIKSQRESAEKSTEAAQATVEAQRKGAQKGAVEVSLVHKSAAAPVDLAIDDEQPQAFSGACWARADLPPGLHVITATPQGAASPTVQKVVDAPTGGVARIEITFP